MANGIAYYSELVEDLMNDHRQLLAIYGDLVRANQAHDPVAFKAVLQPFKSLLISHLLKEAVRLYIYLRQKLRYDESTYRLVTGYKSEMDGISRVAMEFVDEYSAKTPKEIDFVLLAARLKEIGQVLGDRIRREEAELYPLYHDHY